MHGFGSKCGTLLSILTLCACLAGASPDDPVKVSGPGENEKPAKTGETARPAPDKPAWTADLSKVVIPDKGVTGRIHGEEFLIERAELQGDVLTLRQGKEFFADREIKIFLFAGGTRLDGQSLEILDEDNPPVKTVPHVYMSWKPRGETLPKTKTWSGDYVVKLYFGRMTGGRLPGKIYLCLPDMKQSFIAGTFSALVK